jgi:hypothetical protein
LVSRPNGKPSRSRRAQGRRLHSESLPALNAE